MTEQPKVLIVISGLGAGGAERVASTMANYWAGEGRGVGLMTLASLQADHYKLDSAVTRLSLDIIWPSRNSWHGMRSNLRRMRMIRRAIISFDPDLVVSFIEGTNVLVIGALLFSKIPVIVSERIDPRFHAVDRVRRIARRILYPLAESLVVQTKSVAVWGRRVTSARRVSVITNPLSSLPEAPPYENRPRQILAVGRLAEQKGFDLLIRAFSASQLRKDGWTLTILGEGPQRGALENLVERSGLSSQVSLPGVEPAPWRRLQRARVFVLSSRYEGFPNALLEAMAMGCACISTDCPSGPGEIINHGNDGILIAVDDVNGLVAALNDLGGDTGKALQLSECAVRVRERFALERIMADWDALIRRIAGHSGGAP